MENQYDLEAKFSDITWKKTKPNETDTLMLAILTDGSRLTVLHRLTGYSYEIFDTESGYRDSIGKFWLASGNCDVRLLNDATVQQAIDWIKEHANTCIGI